MTTLEKIPGAITARKYLSLGEKSAATFYYNWIIFCCHSILFLIELGVLVELPYFWFVNFFYFYFFNQKRSVYESICKNRKPIFFTFFFLKKIDMAFCN